MRRHASPLTTLAMLATLVGTLAAAPVAAQVVRGFTPRYTTNDNGDITLIGNTLMSCSGGRRCDNGRNGTGNAVNDNDWSMVYVDADGDNTTFCSSSATLALPAGATVLWAGLYWQGDSNNGARNTLRFRTPVTGYQTLTASRLDASGTVYQGFADVTPLVQSAGGGTYWVANVQSTPNSTNRFAGWGLVIVYRLASAPPRNLVVFDGFALVQVGNTVSFGVSGFLTPPAGAVNTRLGVITGEGDLGYTGDSFRLDGVPLSDANNPATNFFNSSISLLGARFTAKNPDYVNQYGWDVDLVSANGVLPNGATSATVTLTSTNDTFYPGVVTFATDLYAPVLSGDGFQKTVTDLNGGSALPGDVLEYALAFRNTGNDGAADVVARDTLPANLSYVPGSLVVVSGANAGAKSDAAGDDQAEYDAASRSVVFRIGAGADALAGGSLAPGEATTVSFRAAIAGPLPGGTVVSNQANVAFDAAQLGTALTAESDGDTVAAGIQPTTITVASTGVVVSGVVYLDADHDGSRDLSEGGIGAASYVKLVPVASPLAAVAVAVVDPTTGAWTLGAVGSGSYALVLDDNGATSDVTPTDPAGFVGTEAGNGMRLVTVGSAALQDQDFGLWAGSRVDGTVFRDDGAGGGIANDGARQAGEGGVGPVRVRALSAACAGGACDSALTDGGGRYTLWIPAAAGVVSIAETGPAGWISTGASAGSSGGLYDRAADEVAFTSVAGAAVSGVDFGDVPANRLVAPGVGSGLAGGSVAYPHTFVAGSAGTVTFSVVETPTPPVPGWGAVLYRDANCNGVVDPGETAVTAPVVVTAGETVCLVLEHRLPQGAPAGDAERVTVGADMSYANASPPLASRVTLDDYTTVIGAGALELVKTVDLASARPGDVLTYTIAYRNLGAEPLSAIRIHDATPAHTVFVAASCGTPGDGLTGCGLTAQPPVGGNGDVTWDLAGSLMPGASGSVTFQVRVQ